MTNPPPPDLRLGLIGDNIALSQAPRLHRCAGALCGLSVVYDRLVPAELCKSFEAVFNMARNAGYRGLNITYPYKETVTALVTVTDPLLAAIGAVNTVTFEANSARGYNTDFTGFIWAYRSVRHRTPPGIVCLIGSGGVGRAVGFGLLSLGARVIRCVDLDPSRAQGLAAALQQAGAGSPTRIEVHSDAATAAAGADGLINCTPLGMAGRGGSPLPGSAMRGASWAFDAVYTPRDTTFLTDAAAQGLMIISGDALFFGQGVDAWTIFSGRSVDARALQRALSDNG